MLKIILLAFLIVCYVSVRVAKIYLFMLSPYIVVPILFVVFQSFIVLRLLERAFQPSFHIPDFIVTTSYILMALVIIFLVYFLIFDFLSLIKVMSFIPIDKKYFILPLVIITFLYGYMHQLSPVVQEYEVVTAKHLNKEVKAVFISDIHIDDATNNKKLQEKIDHINSLEPDIVLIGGDIIDINVTHLNDDRKKILSSIKAPSYAVLGNHEYYSGAIADVQKSIEDSGITVLKDKAVKVDNLSLTLIGRDTTTIRITSELLGSTRKEVAELMKDVDNSTVSIVIDHIPEDKQIDEMMKAGVDINLSGHTHDGQFFPVNLIVQHMYKNAYGQKKFDSLNHIVSSGMGLWGPPIRIGTDAEIVVLKIKN